MFYSKSFIVLALTFQNAFYPFWVNFCKWYEVQVQLHFFHVDIQLSQHHFLIGLFFLHWIVLAPLLKWKSIDHRCVVISQWLSILFHWFMLYLWQFHIILITVALEYYFRSESVSSFILLFFWITLAVLGPLQFHVNFRVTFLFLQESVGILIGIALNL